MVGVPEPTTVDRSGRGPETQGSVQPLGGHSRSQLVGGGKKLSVGKAARSLVLAPLLERKAEGETGQAQALIPSPEERTGNGSRGHLCGGRRCPVSAEGEGSAVSGTASAASTGAQSPGQGPQGHGCRGPHVGGWGNLHRGPRADTQPRTFTPRVSSSLLLPCRRLLPPWTS